MDQSTGQLFSLLNLTEHLCRVHERALTQLVYYMCSNMQSVVPMTAEMMVRIGFLICRSIRSGYVSLLEAGLLGSALSGM